MSYNFEMLPETDEENKGFGLQKKLENNAKKAGAAGATITDHMIGMPIIGTFLAFKSIISTVKHKVKLETLIGSTPACTCEQCSNIIEYLLGQKKKKLIKKGVGAVPMIGTVSTVGLMLKGLYKTINKTKGKRRLDMATTLWYCAAPNSNSEATGCPKAGYIIQEICGKGSVASVLGCTHKGIEELFRKMASS